ncbi:hypothetical protein Cs7R123_36500 [Catellatospora sp. TT07R-123]|uniref:DUF2516 family protein n=1 Tax=Catellatospora sp. TT07R-123 TaxID=2733863 RepID=UPI001B09701B|nr:DUF2516 family protein [Catellatospora sp. TT07R-123]GHJ46308.1 hypothetical protein Cs7R123_36500 [Catellatospora sp. TT07R-123]
MVAANFAFATEALIDRVLVYGITVLLLWAFVDCAFRRADAFVAIGTLQKAVWLLIVGVASLIMVWQSLTFPDMGLLSWLGSFVAAFYLLEVRRGLREAIEGPW